MAYSDTQVDRIFSVPDDSFGIASVPFLQMCGERFVKEILDLDTNTPNPAYLTLVEGATAWDDKTIQVLATGIADVGIHNVRVTLALVAHPTIEVSVDFKITFTCGTVTV